MKKIIDLGHKYELLVLDKEKHGVDSNMVLQFVKRMDSEHPEKFPGNTSEYAGTTMQSVLRCIYDRMLYLQAQKPCSENSEIIQCLERANYLLEYRAAGLHGFKLDFTRQTAIKAPMCQMCGHIVCEHLGALKGEPPVPDELRKALAFEPSYVTEPADRIMEPPTTLVVNLGPSLLDSIPNVKPT